MKFKKNTFEKGKLKFDKNTLLELNQNSLREVNGGGKNLPTTLKNISSCICGHIN
ncbi:hypothetical protein ZONE111904_00460 [Zobellia nedashkovskayae]